MFPCFLGYRGGLMELFGEEDSARKCEHYSLSSYAIFEAVHVSLQQCGEEKWSGNTIWVGFFQFYIFHFKTLGVLVFLFNFFLVSLHPHFVGGKKVAEYATMNISVDSIWLCAADAPQMTIMRRMWCERGAAVLRLQWSNFINVFLFGVVERTLKVDVV